MLKCDLAPKMVDYIEGGYCNISMSIAIDFTASNMYPWDNKSLHYVGENGIFKGNPSQYQQAIRSIGNILSMYDSDKKYPVYGFGIDVARIANGNGNGTREDDAKNTKNGKNVKWTVYHAMAVNKEMNDFFGNKNIENKENDNKNTEDDDDYDEDEIEVNGIYGVEKLYLKTIHTICNYQRKYRLSGPTYCKDILKKSINNAKESLDYLIKSNKEARVEYHVLLLLTDGVIDDQSETSNLLCFILVFAFGFLHGMLFVDVFVF